MPVKSSVTDFRRQFDAYVTQNQINRESKKAVEWLFKKVLRFAPRVNLAKDGKEIGNFATQLVPGKFYLYGYDPKMKNVLPIFDTVPYTLITSIDYERDLFKGVNFHHIPPQARVAFFAPLYKIATDDRIPGGKKDGMIWQKAKEIAAACGKTPLLNEAIRSYLFEQVQTRFILVDKEDWALTASLPLARRYRN